MRKIVILGNGQVWDLKGVDPKNPRKNFEDLFCGRVLAEKARLNTKIFSKYIEKGKSRPTGISVTKALLDKKNKKAQLAAETILKDMGRMAGCGIEVLTKASGYKSGWTKKELNHWRGLSGVIIGGGVSKGTTGTLMVNAIKSYLKEKGLSSIGIFKAKFSGKESGFLGSTANIMGLICKETKLKKLSRIGIIGVDIGREKIGVGILPFILKKGELVRKKGAPWIFSYSLRTPEENKIKSYSANKKAGLVLRERITETIAGLIVRALSEAEKKKITLSKYVAIALPGETTKDGYLIGSTDYLPFFRKQDGFHFSKAVEAALVKAGYKELRIHIINDGIAAGLSNLVFGLGLDKIKPGKYAFLGPGSGLGGCLCQVKEVGAR